MRVKSALMVVAIAGFVSHPVYAGTLNVVNGQATWQSTKCTEPAEPPSLATLGPDTRAANMNKIVTDYNGYSAAMQQYTNCLSNEAQTDASATSDAIIHSAQAVIDSAQKKVASYGLSSKKSP